MDARVTIQLTDAHAFLARYESRKRTWTRVALHHYPFDTRLLPREGADLRLPGRQLATRLCNDHPRGITCRLVIPASWCLMHRVVLPMKRWNDQAALFEFEQYVPVDLEKLTCAVRRTGRQTALVAGVFTEALHAFLDELENNHICVDLVMVDALLLSQNRDIRSGMKERGFLLIDRERITIVLPSDRQCDVEPCRTLGLPSDQPTGFVQNRVLNTVLMLHKPCVEWHLLPLSTRDDLAEITGAIESEVGRVRVHSEQSALAWILDAATIAENAIDLRRGELASARRWAPIHRRILGCAVAAATFLLILAIRLCIDNLSYAAAANELRPLRNQIYQTVFPDADPSPAAALRLRSERIKLEALTDRGDVKARDLSSSALDTFELLHKVMAHIPVDLKVHVNDIVLDDQGIRLAGQTTGHGAAGDLVRQLNKAPGLTVDPPRTKLRKDGTVDFRVRAVGDNDDRPE